MSLDEFELINTYFRKPKTRDDVILGIGDDCAVLKAPQGKCLLVTTDTLNINSHFFLDTPAFDIGYKSIAVSLSDLAAMGGDPAWALLSLTLPKADPDWLSQFSTGIFTCLEAFGLSLVGGNITKGPLAITTQIMGFGSQKNYLTRAGARSGDSIYVTGTLGDSSLALKLIKEDVDKTLFSHEEIRVLIKKLWQPKVRIAEGKLLVGFANAAIDISDGLAADLQHILDESQVGATIYIDRLPLSNSLKRLPEAIGKQLALTGGDDYELCFTIPPDKLSALEEYALQFDCALTCIGEIEPHLGLNLVQGDGKVLHLAHKGYQHF